MPFINTIIHSKVNLSTTDEQKESIKKKIGWVVSSVLGKSEDWLLIEFVDNCDLYFQGNRALPAAFIEVRVFGGALADRMNRLEAAVSEIYETELKIEKNRIYVKCETVSRWAWSKGDF